MIKKIKRSLSPRSWLGKSASAPEPPTAKSAPSTPRGGVHATDTPTLQPSSAPTTPRVPDVDIEQPLPLTQAAPPPQSTFSATLPAESSPPKPATASPPPKVAVPAPKPATASPPPKVVAIPPPKPAVAGSGSASRAAERTPLLSSRGPTEAEPPPALGAARPSLDRVLHPKAGAPLDDVLYPKAHHGLMDRYHPEHRALRVQMAAILYPNRKEGAERDAALHALEEALAAKAPPTLQEWWGRGPDVEHEPEVTESSATKPADSPHARSAIKMQAVVRGRHARRRSSAGAAGGPTGGPVPTPPLPAPSGLDKLAAPLGVRTAALLGAAGGLAAFLLVVALLAFAPARTLLMGLLSVLLWILRLVADVLAYALLLLAGLYAWLRLPVWLGWIGTELLTRLVLYDIPIGFESVRVVPWLTFTPLTLHCDVNVTGFFLGNAPHIGCRARDMVSAERVALTCKCDLRFLFALLRSGGKLDSPIVVVVPTCILSGIKFNMLLGATGVFNLYAIATTINEGEIRAALPKGAPMPNVVRVKVLAARKLLDLPNLKPRIEISVRKTKVTTGVGARATAADGSTVFHFHGVEVTLPTPNAEAVLVVRVFNDNVRFGKWPQLIGQWFMTVKWLHQCPTHCKHSSLTTCGDGAIAGTFLLTDAKLRGSAVRGRGPHDLGDGLSGELDMAVQWTHTDLLDPPPKSWTMLASPFADSRPIGKPIGAIDQLGSTGEDDGLRFGNWAQFKEWLHAIPIRITTEHFVFRKLTIEMSDLFTGAGAGEKERGFFTEPVPRDGAIGPRGNNAYVAELSFAPMTEVSLYTFFEEFAPQVIRRVATDFGALFTATAEVFSGLSTGLGKTLFSFMRATKNAMDLNKDGKLGLSDVAAAGPAVIKAGTGAAVKVGGGMMAVANVTASLPGNAAVQIQKTLRGQLARKAVGK